MKKIDFYPLILSKIQVHQRIFQMQKRVKLNRNRVYASVLLSFVFEISVSVDMDFVALNNVINVHHNVETFNDIRSVFNVA